MSDRTEAQREADRRYNASQKGQERKRRYERKLRPKSTKVCCICFQKHKARGFCNAHYLQWRRGKLE